jgi:5-methyltetrahydropteroyltriglutamate--homocysteine methyltransferase
MTKEDASRYHCEIVGSFLRPDYLRESTQKFRDGAITEAEQVAIQERASVEAIKLQEECGVDVLTDGEMRRRGWTDPLTRCLTGFGPAPMPEGYRVNWNRSSPSDLPPLPESPATGTRAAVINKVTRSAENLMLTEMNFVKEHSNKPFKITLPSLAHASVFWAPGTSDKVYGDKDQYMSDVLEGMSAAVAECIAQGVEYVQLDSPRYTHLVSEEGQENFRQLGIDPTTWLSEVIDLENELVDRFPHVTWGLHLCRGNGARGAWSVSGGYDPIAEQLFNTIHVDRLLLEYDTARAGTFDPLRFMPKDKVAVLGLISTKEQEIETVDLLKGRLDEASKFIGLEQVALSPQCGFASAFEGNIDEIKQRAKMESLRDTVQAVWN